MLNHQKLLDTFIAILNIPSPTFQEEKLTKHVKKIATKAKFYQILESNNSLILHSPLTPGLPHIALVGHLDVVPDFFPARLVKNKNLVYGAGASDMQASLAIFLEILKDHHLLKRILSHYNLSFIFYAREEKTALKDNGLYELIQQFPKYFTTLDLALVGEPTDNEIHLGCLGSLHMKVKVTGEACHSARPWQGKNALYAALPLIQNIAQTKPKKKSIMGVDFYEVIQLTESESEKGITSLPGYWQGNINFRFTPEKTIPQAKKFINNYLKAVKIKNLTTDIYSASPAGKVITTTLLKKALKQIATPIKAKQAWTDVAQFASLKIPAFNFGPGLVEQCHKKNEFARFDLMKTYSELLINFLTNQQDARKS